MDVGEAFCSAMIRSQSFGEPVPLNCELHQFHSPSLPPIRWDRMAGGGLELCIFLLPHRRLEVASAGYFFLPLREVRL